MRHTIAVLVGPPPFQGLIERVLPRFAVPLLCHDADALWRTLESRTVHLVLSDLYDAHGESRTPLLVALRRTYPDLKTLLYVPDGARTVEELHDAVTQGTTWSFAFRPTERLDDAIHHAIAALPIDGVVAVLVRDLLPFTEGSTRSFMTIAALRPSARLTVRWIARHLEVDARTVRRWFARARLPSPSEILDYCFALTATWLLEVDARDPVQVALTLGVAGRAALDQRLRRSVGLTLDQTRRTGAFSMLRRQVVSYFQRHAADTQVRAPRDGRS